MYDELVKTIRKQCSDMDCGDCNTCVKLKAADAIEELQNLSMRQEVKLVELTGELSSKPHWIPVTERLPEETVTVIVTDGVNVGFSFCVRDYGDLEFYSPWKITHWMPLPEPPKEVNTIGQ